MGEVIYSTTLHGWVGRFDPDRRRITFEDEGGRVYRLAVPGDLGALAMDFGGHGARASVEFVFGREAHTGVLRGLEPYNPTAVAWAAPDDREAAPLERHRHHP